MDARKIATVVLSRLQKVNTLGLETRTILCLCAEGYPIPRREGVDFRETDNRPVSYQAVTAFSASRYAETLLGTLETSQQSSVTYFYLKELGRLTCESPALLLTYRNAYI